MYEVKEEQKTIRLEHLKNEIKCCCGQVSTPTRCKFFNTRPNVVPGDIVVCGTCGKKLIIVED